MITIRKASTADASAIAYVHHLSRRAAYQSFVSADELAKTPLPALQSHWSEEIFKAESGASRVLVIEEDEDIFGVGSLGQIQQSAEQTPDAAEICHFYLAPEIWGQGYGQQLLAKIVEDARALGYKRLNLWVFEPNARGRRFYELAGFVADGAIEERSGSSVPAVRYTLDLVSSAQAASV